MKKAQSGEKPRAVSDSSGKKQSRDQEQSCSRARSLTDILAVFSKKPKVSKKDASTNTTPPDEAPPLPPKTNHYCLNKALNKVNVHYEDVYNEVSVGTNMNVESGPWMNTHKEAMSQEENKDSSGDDSVKDSDDDFLDEMPKTTTTHKRNTSGWSLGSFHIGPPVELMNELLTGEEWAQFLEDHVQFSPDTILSVSDEPNGNMSDFETKRETTEDAVDGKLTGKTKSIMDSRIDEIMKSVKIIEQKPELPKVLDEREPPHILPPKVTPTFAAGINKQFRSSVFYKYKLPDPGQKPPPETPKSGALILDKIKAKLRKSSVEELKETEK